MALDQEIIDDLQRELLAHVRSKQRGNVTITYKELIERTGRKLTEQGIGKHLTKIGDDCEHRAQPRLDYLVVNKTGYPGKEIPHPVWYAEIERCRKFPWPA